MVLSIRTSVLLAVALVWIAIVIYRQLTSPLRNVPGPFLARFTRLWLLFKVNRGDLEKTLMKLHAKHGKVVRIAPCEYSIDDPDAIDIVYGRTSAFRKSDMYRAYVFPAIRTTPSVVSLLTRSISFEVPGSPSVFSMRSVRGHVDLRKKYHDTYTMSSMVSYERYVDDCIGDLVAKLKKMATAQSVIDMRVWLQYFAFDVIGAVATAQRFGVLEKGQDVESLIQTVHDILDMSSRLAVFPEFSATLHRTLNFLGQWGIINLSNVSYIEDWTTKLAKKRRTKTESRKLSYDDDQDEESTAPKDILTKFMENHIKDQNSFTWSNVIDMSIINITAGSDTISSTVSTVLFYLLKYPKAAAKLREEMSHYQERGELSSPPAFRETQQLKYLRAVIKESLRLGSAFGFPFARTVPDGGANLCGYFFPADSVVGINPYVAHNNRDVFGADASEFRPERWLKSETNEATLSRMERYFLAWGLGTRTCLGRNIALMEMQKLLPELLRNFDFEMGPGLRETGKLETKNRQVVLVMNLLVHIKPRQVASASAQIPEKANGPM